MKNENVSRSVMSDSEIPWTVAHWAPLSVEFSRQEYRSGLPFPSGPITSRQIDGETMEIVTDFIFLGSKIPADGDCSHEIKRCLLLGTKAMTNLESIFKNRHNFANKGPSSQSYGFSGSHVWM